MRLPDSLQELVESGAPLYVVPRLEGAVGAAIELRALSGPIAGHDGHAQPARGAPAGLSVRRASADERVLVRQDIGSFVLEGAGVREPLYSGPMNHASISLGAAGEDFLLARLEGNQGLSLTSSGEGGPLRLAPDVMKWESLQAASAHFGITAPDLRLVRDVEIKINQGAKPGKGGRLAAPKVTATVSRARNIPVGTDALSPDPKHDIYSIEDMPAEVWLWLHFDVHCGIKITGSTYTRYVAAGMWSNFVVDYLLVDAGLGGSGNYHADSSRVGWPDMFRTILHTHHALLHEPLRDEETGQSFPIRDGNGRAFGADGGTRLLASGGLRSELDMIKVHRGRRRAGRSVHRQSRGVRLQPVRQLSPGLPARRHHHQDRAHHAERPPADARALPQLDRAQPGEAGGADRRPEPGAGLGGHHRARGERRRRHR